MEEQAYNAMRTSMKGLQDMRVWNYFRETPADCIGGPKQSYKVHSRKRDRLHSELVQTMLNRKMLTLKNYDLKKKA